MYRQAYDEVYKLLQNPTKEQFRKFMQYMKEEDECIDFKEKWTDPDELAKIVLGMANNRGGLVVFGVAENGDGTYSSIGLEGLEDKTKLYNKISPYIPQSLKFDVLNFDYEATEYSALIGKKFQLLSIEDNPEDLPYVSMKDGAKINRDTIYIRRGVQSIKANYDDIQMVLNRRIETNYSSSSQIQLKEHLEQLKILYGEIDKEFVQYTGGISESIGKMISQSLSVMVKGEAKRTPNPLYPNQTYEEWISELIPRKRKRIEKLLDI